MGAAAVDRDTLPERDTDRADGRSAAKLRVPAELERLLLRAFTWDNEHPHHIMHRTQHKVVTTGFRLGYGRFDDDMVVTTTGRKSGLPRHVIVGAIVIDDRLYVVNPFGDRAHWYRNLVVDPIVTLQRRSKMWTARATRVTDLDEAVMLYERTPGSTGTMLRWLLRAQGLGETAEEFADNIDRFCFVRFDEVDEPGPPPMKADLAWVWPVACVTGAIAWMVRRRRGPAIAMAALSVPALVGAALGWGRVEARFTDSGIHLDGLWAHLWPRLDRGSAVRAGLSAE